MRREAFFADIETDQEFEVVGVVEVSTAAEIAREADAELAALQTRLADAERRLAEAERRATQFSHQQITLVNRVTALQTRLAEAEAQRAVLVAALEDLITGADEADRLLPYGHGLRTLPARQALANQPPSDLVALVKVTSAFRRHEAKCQANQDAGNLKDHVVKRLELLGEMYDALDTLLTNQPEFRALIDREGV